MTQAQKDRWYQADRLGGLRRFAAAITILNILGHTLLGFEPAWAHPFVAMAAAYSLEILLEVIDARTNRRAPRFMGGGIQKFIDFILSAHISAMAVSMLLYANDRWMPVAFAAAVAIGSKALLQIRSGDRMRHFLNPSNFGITVTLLLFPWVGIAQPYQFTENLGHYGDWILPAIIICSGTFLNWRFTHRLPLIATWVTMFALQATARHFVLGTAWIPALVPLTGVAFLLFTFYMITDPPTTPATKRGQIAFGVAVASIYGLLMASHIVFGFFFALSIVTATRGAYLWYLSRLSDREASALLAPAPSTPSIAHAHPATHSDHALPVRATPATAWNVATHAPHLAPTTIPQTALGGAD